MPDRWYNNDGQRHMWRFSFRGGLVRVTVSGLLFFTSPHPSRAPPTVMRLLLLTAPGPLSWSAHYVEAFRRHADCRVLGPVPEHGSPNAIHFDGHLSFEPPGDVHAALPPGWSPDAVVGVTGPGGMPLHPGVAQWPWPAAFVTIDTWQCLIDYVTARAFDFTFVAQLPYVARLRAAGAANVSWLPLAANPNLHYPLPDVSPSVDISFAGAHSTPVHEERRLCLEELARHFSVRREEHVYGDDMCRVFADGRLAFNQAAVREVNMRVFEALAMGRCLVTDRGAAYSGLFDLFEEGTHLVTYGDVPELVARCGELLHDASRRAGIARAGRDLVLAHHTYDHRVCTILEALRPHVSSGKRPIAPGERLFEHLPRVPGRVLDWHEALGASRIRLERMGATHVLGVLSDRATLESRAGSYHAACMPEEVPNQCCDTFAAEISSNSVRALDHTLAAARQALPAGGTLLLKVPHHLVATWEVTLFAQGFALQRACDCGETRIVRARRRTRSLRDVVRASFEALQLPGYDPEDIAARVPRTW